MMTKPLYCLALLACACSMIVGAEPADVDQVDDNNDNSSGADTADTDAGADADTDTDTDSDTDTDTDTDSDTDTDTDADSDTDADVCPWDCLKNIGQFTCDTDWNGSGDGDGPTVVHNWTYDAFCLEGYVCCQPIDATEQGAFSDYCLDLQDAGEPVKCESVKTCKTPYPAYCWTVGNVCCNE